ncbi:MAG TPA: hypothetical protein VJV79_21800 [Polyangiaceae bacterium]|nr:hypothetical protein [Polyangiaceae bacterium]
MRRLSAILVSTLFPFSLLTLSAQGALAQQPDSEAPPPAAAPAPPPGAVLVPIAAPEPEFKPFAIIANPLALLMGRYSLQGEYMPAMHHAITLNPFYNHTPVKVTDVSTGAEYDAGSLNGFGAELGYKFYTGKKGANGFFVGPSILFGSYSNSMTGRPDTSFTSVGGALDIGGQAIIGGGFVIGGGFGLQWTKTSEEIPTEQLNLTSAAIAGGGTRPRFLFTIGYAF